MKERTDKRLRWDHLNHVYFYTTPHSLLFSYKTLNPGDKLESNIISLMKPVQYKNMIIHIDYVSEKCRQFQNDQGFLDMNRVSKDYFYEKLVSIAGHPDINEEFIKQSCLKFDNGKGFELNTGKRISLNDLKIII
jgi:hypothetical protein